jgi:hypothetical protein
VCGHSDCGIVADDASDIGGRQVTLAHMDAIGSGEPRDVSPVVHDKQRTCRSRDRGDFIGKLEKRSAVHRLCAQLDQTDTGIEPST